MGSKLSDDFAGNYQKGDCTGNYQKDDCTDNYQKDDFTGNSLRTVLWAILNNTIT